MEKNILLTGAFYVGLLDGLLGVAGGCWDDDMKLAMTGIIPEKSLRKTHQEVDWWI